MFLNEKQIVESISKLFSNSKKVDCAVAFIGKRALEIIPKNCEVRIICNLESEATNPNAIKELIERGGNNKITSGFACESIYRR